MRSCSHRFLLVALLAALSSLLPLTPASACEIANIPCSDYEGLSKISLNKSALSTLEEWRAAKVDDLQNQRYLTLFDVSQHSATPRFHVIDTQEKSIRSYLAAHGKGSDKDHDGYATVFSDVPGSKATPLGFFKTSETYTGKHGISLKLDGLEKRNKNARQRAIVIHGADYVDTGRDRLGRSWGCPALARQDIDHVIDDIKGGSLLYIHNGDIS